MDDKGKLESTVAAPNPRVRVAGLILGPVVFLFLASLAPPNGLSPAGWNTAAIAAWMAIWWMTEALPLGITSLLPLVLFPLSGVAPIRAAAAPYANPLIFLFLGGFLLALALQRWGLHRRIALAVLSRSGTQPHAVIGTFMLVTAALSMWVSNTATTAMMVPLALSVLAVMEETRHTFAKALLLGIAYGASIGGVATLVGTPPNALLAGFMAETYRAEIGFAQWMIIGLPVSLTMLALTWWLLTRVLFKLPPAETAGADALADARAALPPISRAEKLTAVVFAATALAWLFRPLLIKVFPGLGLSDSGIAMMAAVLLFAVPVSLSRAEFLMNWEWARKTPWDILLLFGGGLSLAAAIQKTGLAPWIGDQMGALEGWPILMILLAVVTLIVFLTEITSNTATAAAFLPVVAALAISLGENPLLFAVPAVLGASCAFMMPVATPPNAIVFGSERLSIMDMAGAGFWVNIVGIVVITTAAYALLGIAFGVGIGILPDWATQTR